MCIPYFAFNNQKEAAPDLKPIPIFPFYVYWENNVEAAQIFFFEYLLYNC